MNFIADYKKLILDEITAMRSQNYVFPTKEELENDENISLSADAYEDRLVSLYMNWVTKKIPCSPRTIKYCNNFSCPSGYEAGLHQVEQEIQNGDDLSPRLSRQIYKAQFKDKMLFDFGITHLHLGTTNDARHPGLIQGREKILYVRFNHKNEAIFICINQHGLWDDRSLLEELDNSFPDELNDFVLPSQISSLDNYTDAERVSFKERDVNTSIVINGKTIMSPGGGFSCAGTSMNSSILLAKTNKILNKIQSIISDYLEDVGASSADFKLVYFDGRSSIIARDASKNTICKFDCEKMDRPEVYLETSNTPQP